MDVPVLEN